MQGEEHHKMPDLSEGVRTVGLLRRTRKPGTAFRTQRRPGPVVIILGSEEKGISRELLAMSDLQVSVPISGTIGSLNVSVSAGIMLYEVNETKRLVRQ